MSGSQLSSNESPGRRAAAYWFQDGLPDLVFGASLILIAGFQVLWRISFPALAKFDILIVGVGFVLYLWKNRALLEFLKSRITYPRTGYVNPPHEIDPWEKRAANLSLLPQRPADENVTTFNRGTVAAVFWLCYIAASDSVQSTWVVPAKMAILAAVLYFGNRKSERPYSWWSALLLALAGPIIWLARPSSETLMSALQLGVPGVWLTVQGAVSLARYLEANPGSCNPESVRA